MHMVKVRCYNCSNNVSVSVADDEDLDIITSDTSSRAFDGDGESVCVNLAQVCDYADDASIPEVVLCPSCLAEYEYE